MEYLFPVVGLFWLVQFGLAYWQLRRFHRRVSALRRVGRCAVGVYGDRWRGRTYAVLAVDHTETVRHAEVFAGWTVLAQLRPVASLEGQPLAVISGESGDVAGISPAQRAAFVHAAGFLRQPPQAALELS